MIQLKNDPFAEDRKLMVETQLIPRNISNPRVLEAFREVPRDYFVLDQYISSAYDDNPLPIIDRQTISQPYIAALMTELLELPDTPGKILEIGAGSGYQAAILAYLGHDVVTIDRLPTMAKFAEENLTNLPYREKVEVVVGDGCLGCEEKAPFDGILVTAAAPQVPDVLIEQLKVAARLVIPCGSLFVQEMLQIVKISEHKIQANRGIGCRFVPLIGEGAFQED